MNKTLVYLHTEFVINIIQYVMLINVLLFIFNMIPIPPLDGSRIVTALFNRNREFVQNYNRYGVYILIAFLMMDQFFGLEILPISRMMNFILRLMISLVIPGAAGSIEFGLAGTLRIFSIKEHDFAVALGLAMWCSSVR